MYDLAGHPLAPFTGFYRPYLYPIPAAARIREKTKQVKALYIDAIPYKNSRNPAKRTKFKVNL